MLNLSDILEGYSKAIYPRGSTTRRTASSSMRARVWPAAWRTARSPFRRVCLRTDTLTTFRASRPLIHIRMAGMGEKTLPLDVYYPEGDNYIEGLRQHLDRAMGRRTFDLNWHAVGPDCRIPLTAEDDDPPRQHERWLETFAPSIPAPADARIPCGGASPPL